MTYTYKFSDGEVYKLINKGFSTRDIWALEKIHGRCISVDQRYERGKEQT